jgi:fatty acid desaturase
MATTSDNSLSSNPLKGRIDWPTLAVAATIYGGFGLLTWFYDALPWWLVLPLGAYLVAWQGSLQHEVVHGHPTPWRAVNELLIFPSLWLWLPYPLYRDSHLLHHRDEHLTDPRADPESFYLSPETWAGMGPVRRGTHWWLNTLSGRLLLGPAHCVGTFASAEIRRFARGDFTHLGAWLTHGAATAVVLFWVLWVSKIPLVGYLAFFAYPGLSLTLLRSFLEHQAREEVGHRTAVVEAGPILSLLFLHNNLHAAHHAAPGLAWYRIPGRYRAERAHQLAVNGGYVYRGGYAEVFARYLLWPKERPVHPMPGRTASPLTPPIPPTRPLEPVTPLHAEPAV